MVDQDFHRSTASWKEALIVFFVFLFIYSITARGDIRVSDEIAVFGAGISLVEEGNLEINNLLFVDKEVDLGEIGRDGNLYAKYPPGNILVTSLLYFLFSTENDSPYILNLGLYEEEPVVLALSNFGAHISMMGNSLLGAIAMMFLFLILRQFFDLKTSIFTILCVGLCTNWWYQSRGYLSELGAGTFIIVSLYFAAVGRPYLSGINLGISMLYRPTNILAFPIWVLSFWNEDFQTYLKNIKNFSIKQHIQIAKKTYLSGFTIVFFVIIWMMYNWWRYEAVFNIGYSGEGFTTPLIRGLLGVLFSPISSILLYSPILLLAIPGVKIFYQRNKAFTLASVLTCVFYIVLIAKWNSWEGGFAWGERLLIPIVPIAGFFVAPVIEYAWKKKEDFILIGLLAIIGLGMQFSVIARDPFWVMVDALDRGDTTWPQVFKTLNNSWIAVQFRSLPGWRFCEIDSWLLRALFRCVK